MLSDDNTVPLADYSAALDEIYRLRRALAYEAAVAKAHGEYKTFPKSRRDVLDSQIERMRAAARGNVLDAYRDRPHFALDATMREAGAKTTLTRHAWEQERRA